MDVPWIGPTAHPTEQFECLDCSLVANLDVHGKCERCGSAAVLQLQLLEKTGRWAIFTDAAHWIPAERQYWKAADTESSSAQGRKNAVSATKKKLKLLPLRVRLGEECA
jgi:hypothetical protein